MSSVHTSSALVDGPDSWSHGLSHVLNGVALRASQLCAASLIQRSLALHAVLFNTLARWHFRKERVTHQAWQPYVVFPGAVAWVGLMSARLHPALALCFIVPFMPGPDMEKLAMLDNEVMVEAA